MSGPLAMHHPDQAGTAPPAASAGGVLLDRLGIGLSGLCAVHCLLAPLLLATLPLWPPAEALHEWLHPFLALLILPVTVQAMRGGCRRHGSGRAPLLLGAGLVLIVAALLLGHTGMSEPGEAVLTLLGSSLLVAGHWHNRCTLSRGA